VLRLRMVLKLEIIANIAQTRTFSKMLGRIVVSRAR
jgi:hypothetical protein